MYECVYVDEGENVFSSNADKLVDGADREMGVNKIIEQTDSILCSLFLPTTKNATMKRW